MLLRINRSTGFIDTDVKVTGLRYINSTLWYWDNFELKCFHVSGIIGKVKYRFRIFVKKKNNNNNNKIMENIQAFLA